MGPSSLSWRVLQLADSAFPVGGFAHSGGLEAAAQWRELSSVRAFATEWLQQLGRAGLPLVNAAYLEPERLALWDARADAFLVNHVARRASQQQGRALVETCARIFPGLEALRGEVKSQRLRAHHAPLFGAAFALLEVALPDAQQLYLSQGLKGLLSAAVRLNLLGTHHAQALQSELAPALEAVWVTCRDLGAEGLAQTSPLLDLLGSTHDRLYSRLFLS